ncbi:MAG: HAMP domain-containing histidine kinase [Lachnospiraceae bacterium]|nr:HAMP domain-containing histidine kinase [Lachnospiraceae bacterium]
MGLFNRKKKKKETMYQEPVVPQKAYKKVLEEKKLESKLSNIELIPAKAGRRYKDEKWRWAFMGLILSAVCAIVLQGFYGVFRSNAEKSMSSPIENAENISWLYQNCYLLYRDLYNTQYNEQLGYMDLYLEVTEEQQWLLDEEQIDIYMDSLIDVEENEEAAEYEEITQGDLTYSQCGSIQEELEILNKYFQSMDNYFRNLNSNYDYIIRDNNTGKYITNMSTSDLDRGMDEQYFLLSFCFDNAGNVTIEDQICGMDENQIRKYANEVIREDILENMIAEIKRFGRVKRPVNCTVTYAISRDAWTKRGVGDDFGTRGGYLVSTGSSFYFRSYNFENAAVEAYWNSGTSGIVLMCLAGMVLLGFLLPLPGDAKPWKETKICAFPLEILFIIGTCIAVVSDRIIVLIAYTASGRAVNGVRDYLPIFKNDAGFIVSVFNLAVITGFFFSGWYLGICARALRDLGIKQYIKKKSLIYRFFPFVKRKTLEAYGALVHLDLTQDAHKTILRIVFVNALILFFISSLWFGGFAITLVYSLVLYLILRKYVSDLQKKYKILFQAVDEIAAGNLNVMIREDLGVFEPFRNEIYKIQEGLKKAVTMEVKSQRIKTELVTNMSHDLKTPLTAIITYVNLLKNEKLTEEQREEYLQILERKSLRLKSLIEDLFEFSKANSQNITLNIMDVDIMNLIKQVSFEMSDKISAAGLDVRMNLTEEKVILPLDSQKTYRIYENLFVNIAKYALPGTRVYVNGFRLDDRVIITLKNISAQEITVEASELTERFVRGNASRNTEGSGLGLAIAKSFMELQGGTLELEVDGDLFKVTTTWYVREKEKPAEE